MKFIDFFAGIGGMRRGMELAGHECVGFCEFDKYARASYISMHLITTKQYNYLSTLEKRKRLKEILKPEYLNGEWAPWDIRDVKAEDIPKADCWCGGFPCQDISVAGKQEGLLNGKRSGLFYEIIRLLKEQKEEDRPEWILLENVKNLLSIDGGRGMFSVLSELDGVGYDCQWQLFNSKDYVPQNRERIYIVGHLRRYGSAEIFPIEGSNRKNSVQLTSKINILGHRDGYRRNLQVFDRNGITETLDTCTGGGRGHHTIEVIGKAYDRENYGDNRNRILGVVGVSPSLTATQYKEPYRVGLSLSEIQTRQAKV